jgi:hypothetical protein
MHLPATQKHCGPAPHGTAVGSATTAYERPRLVGVMARPDRISVPVRVTSADAMVGRLILAPSLSGAAVQLVSAVRKSG